MCVCVRERGSVVNSSLARRAPRGVISRRLWVQLPQIRHELWRDTVGVAVRPVCAEVLLFLIFRVQAVESAGWINHTGNVMGT